MNVIEVDGLDTYCASYRRKNASRDKLTSQTNIIEMLGVFYNVLSGNLDLISKDFWQREKGPAAIK